MDDGGATGVDVAAMVAETVAFIQVRADGDGWVGDAPSWFGDRLFGGFVVGQAVHAATRAAPAGRRIHSLHGYFLRPARAGVPIRYSVRAVRDGRTFATRHLVAAQAGDAIFEMACSFTADTDGYAYELPASAGVPRPDEIGEHGWGPGPFRRAWVGPTDPEPDGTRRSTHRAWFRMGSPIEDDPDLHAALAGFLTDVTGVGGRPLRLDGDTTGMVSLDHAVWFHRPARVDEWLLYDVHSLVNAGGRGLLRGTFHAVDGTMVASVAQEMLLRPL